MTLLGIVLSHGRNQARDPHAIKIVDVNVGRQIDLDAIDHVPDQRKVTDNQLFFIHLATRGLIGPPGIGCGGGLREDDGGVAFHNVIGKRLIWGLGSKESGVAQRCSAEAR